MWSFMYQLLTFKVTFLKILQCSRTYWAIQQITSLFFSILLFTPTWLKILTCDTVLYKGGLLGNWFSSLNANITTFKWKYAKGVQRLTLKIKEGKLIWRSCGTMSHHSSRHIHNLLQWCINPSIPSPFYHCSCSLQEKSFWYPAKMSSNKYIRMVRVNDHDRIN